MYDNEFETKENKFKPGIKLNHNSYFRCRRSSVLHDFIFCLSKLLILTRASLLVLASVQKSLTSFPVPIAVLKTVGA